MRLRATEEGSYRLRDAEACIEDLTFGLWRLRKALRSASR